MSDEQYNFALLNKALYNPNPQSVLNETKRGRKYTILEENTNDMTVKDKNTGKIILVIKGTDISNLKGQRQPDLIQDLGILLNNKEMVTRTKEMENKTEDLIKKYGKNNVTVTGHSLAGYIASELSGNLDVKAVAFNIGSSPFNRTRDNRVKGNQTKHYTTNVGSNFDPVSLTAARVDNYDRVQVEPNQAIGSGILKYHTIDHFLEKENNNIDNNKKMNSRKQDISFISKNSKLTKDDLKMKSNSEIDILRKRVSQALTGLQIRKDSKKKLNENEKAVLTYAVEEAEKEIREERIKDSKKNELDDAELEKRMVEMRKKQKKAVKKKAKGATRRFKINPSYSGQKEAISAEVEKRTGLPTDLSDLISEYAGEPDIRFKTPPRGKERVPQARRLFIKILQDNGLQEEDFKELMKEFNITDKRQLTDKKVSEILNDMDDDLLYHLGSGNKDLVTELETLRDSLPGKSTIIRRIQSDVEEEQKYDEWASEADKLYQMGLRIQQTEQQQTNDYGYAYSGNVIGDSGYQNTELNDNFIRGVNSYSSFQTNPTVPVRRQFRNISRQIDNAPMRVDPDPSTYPEESLLQQNAMLEGNPDVMPQVDPESSRGNLSYATTNMASYEQNQLMADTRNTRRGVRRGQDPDDEGDVSDEEEEGKYNRDDDRLFDQDDEGELNNRERVELELEMESSRNLGRWSGDNRSRLNDFQRAARDKKDADSMRDSAFLNSLREKPIPWKKPSRTYQNNSVGLIRNSNRSMQLAVSEMIP